ncbi:MAG: glycosyltransferase family 39 protein, partial [Candidatus Altiarchaeota archaeon]|nr:glycosyltransferase family 39 protein [Candidatus Altiarchaeota archaeon]
MKSFLDDVDDFLKDRFLVFCIVSSVIILWMSFSSQSLFFIPSAGFFDETENLHASWLVYRGYIPYRDFFEHHTPLTWYVLSPLFNFYMDDIRILNTGKQIMLLISFLDLLIVYSISRQYMGVKPSLLAVTLLATQYNFFLNMSKIYNEAFLIFFTLLSFRFLLAGLKNKSNTWFFLAGTAMGIGFGFKQTALLLFPVIPVSIFTAYISKKKAREIMGGISSAGVGFLIPVVAVALFFYMQGSAAEFIYHVFLLNIYSNKANFFLRLFDFSRMYRDILFWIPGYICLFGDLRGFKAGELNPGKKALVT